MRLKDKVAIITGGSSGIGRSIATRFSQEGATVIIADHDVLSSEALGETVIASGGKADVFYTDVTDASQVNKLVEHTITSYSKLDILVNNAGIGPFKTILDTSLAEWDSLMDVNLKGVFLMSKAVIPVMGRQNGGNIINVSSQLGLVGDSNHAAYCASKGGVVQLTRAMAVDHAMDQIRINCVCPGPTWTPMFENQIKFAQNPDEEQKRVENKVPLRRIAQPNEIASVVLFLASEDSSYMTGSVVVVDGGWTAQ